MIFVEGTDGCHYMIKIDLIDVIKSNGKDKSMIFIKNKKEPIQTSVSFDTIIKKIVITSGKG